MMPPTTSVTAATPAASSNVCFSMEGSTVLSRSGQPLPSAVTARKTIAASGRKSGSERIRLAAWNGVKLPGASLRSGAGRVSAAATGVYSASTRVAGKRTSASVPVPARWQW